MKPGAAVTHKWSRCRHQWLARWFTVKCQGVLLTAGSPILHGQPAKFNAAKSQPRLCEGCWGQPWRCRPRGSAVCPAMFAEWQGRTAAGCRVEPSSGTTRVASFGQGHAELFENVDERSWHKICVGVASAKVKHLHALKHLESGSDWIIRHAEVLRKNQWKQLTLHMRPNCFLLDAVMWCVEFGLLTMVQMLLYLACGIKMGASTSFWIRNTLKSDSFKLQISGDFRQGYRFEECRAGLSRRDGLCSSWISAVSTTNTSHIFTNQIQMIFNWKVYDMFRSNFHSCSRGGRYVYKSFISSCVVSVYR